MFTHNDKFGIVDAVFGFSSISKSRILPVEVNAVKVVLTQEANGTANESPPPSGICNHGTELPRALVPTSDSNKSFEVPIVRLEGCKLAVSTYKYEAISVTE